MGVTVGGGAWQGTGCGQVTLGGAVHHHQHHTVLRIDVHDLAHMIGQALQRAQFAFIDLEHHLLHPARRDAE